MKPLTVVEMTTLQKELLRQADNMASAACGFSSHGYDTFINAREEFIETITHLDDLKDK